ncbi:hypothetical protein PIB30_093064, partial [Stylosanthes scabra]|nr:hypothetical protein [Stylosanthes scabra]
MEEVERKAKSQAAELESCRSALTQEEKKVESLAQSKGKQTALDEAEAAAIHWRDEWKSLGEETEEMVQETFKILMDQVRHLNPAIHYSMITLDTRWDPKAKRIYNPKRRRRVSRNLKSSRSLWSRRSLRGSRVQGSRSSVPRWLQMGR